MYILFLACHSFTVVCSLNADICEEKNMASNLFIHQININNSNINAVTIGNM